MLESRCAKFAMCCVLLVACGGNHEPSAKQLVAPRVEAASVLAPDGAIPPYVLLLDDTGVRIAQIRAWPTVEPHAKPASLDAIARQIGTTVKALPDPAYDGLPGPQSQMGPRGPFDPVGIGGDLEGRPSRIAQVTGEVTKGRMAVRAMVLAPPALAATKLIDVVAATEAAIGVSHRGKIRPLHLDFMHHDNALVPWLEARVSKSRVTIEAVPDTPIETSLDHIGDALAKARDARKLPAAAPVDVVVDADVTVQRLVDVLVALDVAGVPMIGMSGPPSETEQALRGHRTPFVTFGQLSAQGDLDKALIRRAIKARQSEMLACFAAARAKQPALEGTVMVQFFVTPSGNVAAASGEGMSREMATCMEDVVKATKFPPPKGGGGCQVEYPFTFRD